MQKNSITIDTQDIIGNIIGPYKVLQYCGIQIQRHKKYKDGRKLHVYQVQCTICGHIRTMRRDVLISGYHGDMCSVCCKSTPKQREVILEVIENDRENIKPRKSNKSTGIKRYCISRDGHTPDAYLHYVECRVDGKKYILCKRYVRYGDQPIPEMIEIANQLNEIMSHGKEVFLQWYKENFE